MLTPERPNPDTSEPRDTRVEFHNQLDGLNATFVTGAVEVADAMPELVAGYIEGDTAVIERSRDLSIRTGRACEDIEDHGFILLAREAPVAGDLRRLVAILRMTTNIDRAASLLAHVCATVDRYDPRQLRDDARQQLVELAERSAGVFRSGVDAWRQGDALAVTEIDDADEAVDQLRDRLIETASTADMASDAVLVLGQMGRYFERIADHGVSIARDAAFVATGQRVRTGKRRANYGRSID